MGGAGGRGDAPPRACTAATYDVADGRVPVPAPHVWRVARRWGRERGWGLRPRGRGRQSANLRREIHV